MELEVKKAQHGDKEAFIRLFRSIELELYGLAKSIVKRDEDCADVFQETTLKAYKALITLKEPKFFKTWVIRILINECNQLLRKQELTVADPQEVSYLPPRYFENYDKVDLQGAVDHLDASLRVVITLFYYQDMPIKQISSVLDISEGAVKTRLHRARGILAEWYQYSLERKMICEPI
ncbi:RNA polymerase [Paenibacillus macquariensis subsp. defensor]|nr:RNA polymerase [Paenibacillus macquariensis subsp. defensor]